MTFLKRSFYLVLLIACNSNSKNSKLKIAELKKNHEARINLIRIIQEPMYKKVPDSMKNWIPILKNVLANDQKNRIIGYNFYTEKEKKEQLSLDSQNQKIVVSYLDKYGWPTMNDIGFFGQRAIGMTIQHSPISIQEKYYPFLIEAFKKDSLLYEKVALMEDRINMRNNKFQHYGSQVVVYKGKQVLYPVYNIDSIDAIRKKIGIKMSIKDYLEMLKVKWDINEYKRMLPEIIKEFKVSNTPGIHFIKEKSTQPKR